MDLELEGKIALVTGSSKGLGFATARELLREGANVVINGRNLRNLDNAIQSLSKEFANRVIGVAGDMTIQKSCVDIVNKTSTQFGGIDILITNCGGPPTGRFEDFDTSDWLSAFHSAFMSHNILIKNSLHWLRKSKTPSVLSITSLSIKKPIRDLILSNTIRAATASLIKSLSLDLGEEGIRFNAILPGYTLTDRMDELISQRANTSKDTSYEKEMVKIMSGIPLKRLASPEEFAKASVICVFSFSCSLVY